MSCSRKMFGTQHKRSAVRAKTDSSAYQKESAFRNLLEWHGTHRCVELHGVLGQVGTKTSNLDVVIW